MSLLAPTLQAFFTERLVNYRRASPHTIAAYRDTLRLLLNFALRKTAKPPSRLDFEDLDAKLVGAFLEHLEVERHNSIPTRNARLAAIHALFRFAALRHPEHAEVINRVLAIPAKRFNRNLVAFLTRAEMEALLSAPDRTSWIGRRDHALLLIALQCGLRVSELTRLTCQDVQLRDGPHVRCQGKGRKERSTPLTPQTVAVLRVWLKERRGGPSDPLFPSRRGGMLSRDAVSLLLSKYANAVRQRFPLLLKKRISPHVLRHTAAMQLLAAGVDTSMIALWLGHEGVETTQIYLHADLALKERALSRTAPPGTKRGRYRAPDSLMAFLESLDLFR